MLLIPNINRQLGRQLSRGISTQVAITDPLIMYQNMVSLGRLEPDIAQHRAATEFRKLYYRVKDYTPPLDYSRRIDALAAQVEELYSKQDKPRSIVSGPFSSWFGKSEKLTPEGTELIRILTDEEELANFPSPQGLLLHGGVGCGKSMLMDIFAECLPYESKKRWHYNNFMLWVYSEIFRISQQNIDMKWTTNVKRWRLQHEFILLQIAQKMIQENTILLLDEFMLPDMAAAKIVKTLFIYFFKLGGVLVATSNRLPKDLYATNFNKSQFESFYDILHSRCVSYSFTSPTDWREVLSSQDKADTQSNYFLSSPGTDKAWKEAIKTNYKELIERGSAATLNVYNRQVFIPWASTDTAYFDFASLCDTPLAAADYISIASSFRTIILDNVPVLTTHMKGPARRLITLLDALYECRCQLLIKAAAEPDNLFFPDSEEDTGDLMEQEVFSKAALDLTAPYRPNVSTYDDVAIKDIIPDTERQGVNTDVDYTKVSAFTGEDEKFAFRRAVSRLKQMTESAQWRSVEWSPVEGNLRPWERKQEGSAKEDNESSIEENPGYLSSSSTTTSTGTTNSSPYRTHPSPPPEFHSPLHFWSMVEFGPKAGERRKDEIAKRWLKGNTVV